MGPLSRRETPAALFAIDRALDVRALNVAPWADRANSLATEKPTADELSRIVRELAHLNPVPPDAEVWATLNLFHTGFQSDVPVSDSFVIATRPEYFALDWHELPLSALAAIVRAWQVIEEIGRERGEIPLLFGNAGGPLSGRSLTDPHGASATLRNAAGSLPDTRSESLLVQRGSRRETRAGDQNTRRRKPSSARAPRARVQLHAAYRRARACGAPHLWLLPLD